MDKTKKSIKIILDEIDLEEDQYQYEQKVKEEPLDSESESVHDHVSPNSSDSERIAPIVPQLTTPRSPIPKTRKCRKKHKHPKDSIFVPNISTVRSCHRSCFICVTKKGLCRFSVTTKTRLKIWKLKQIFIPPTNRNCKTHLDPETGEIKDTELELVVSKMRKTVEISRNDQLISLVNGLNQEALVRNCFVDLGLRCDESSSQNHRRSAPSTTPTKLQRRRRVIRTPNLTSDSEGDSSEDDDGEDDDNQSYRKRKAANCPIEDCVFRTRLKTKVIQHLNEIHEMSIDGIQICKICFKIFPDLPQYKEHYNSHAGEPGVITCPEKECNLEKKAFLRADYLKHHRAKVHGQMEYTRRIPSNCPKCNKTLFSRDTLHNHIAAAHPEEPVKKNLICELCGRKFITDVKLREHKRGAHAPESVKLSCPHPGCSFKAPTKIRIARHVVIHSEQRNLQCHMCPKRYKEPGGLRQHLLSHETERKWVCNTCGTKSSFNQKACLIQHFMGTHGLNRREALDVINQESNRTEMSNAHS